MDKTDSNKVEAYFASEITRLNFKSIVLKSACKKFDLSKEEAISTYHEVRQRMKKTLFLRAWTYLLLGSIFLGVGLFGTFSKTGFIFYGAILAGFGMVLTAIGYFRIALLKS